MFHENGGHVNSRRNVVSKMLCILGLDLLLMSGVGVANLLVFPCYSVNCEKFSCNRRWWSHWNRQRHNCLQGHTRIKAVEWHAWVLWDNIIYRIALGSRQFSVHCADWTTYTVTTRSRPSGSLKTADVYAPWCHLVFRHASVMTAVVIGWYLKTGDARFSQRIGWNVSRPWRNTVASDAWPSF